MARLCSASQLRSAVAIFVCCEQLLTWSASLGAWYHIMVLLLVTCGMHTCERKLGCSQCLLWFARYKQNRHSSAEEPTSSWVYNLGWLLRCTRVLYPHD